MLTQFSVTLKKEGSMMSTVKKKPTQLTGIGQIIEISRLTFLPRTFSICSLEVDFQPVSHVTFEMWYEKC